MDKRRRVRCPPRVGPGDSRFPVEIGTYRVRFARPTPLWDGSRRTNWARVKPAFEENCSLVLILVEVFEQLLGLHSVDGGRGKSRRSFCRGRLFGPAPCKGAGLSSDLSMPVRYRWGANGPGRFSFHRSRRIGGSRGIYRQDSASLAMAVPKSNYRPSASDGKPRRSRTRMESDPRHCGNWVKVVADP